MFILVHFFQATETKGKPTCILAKTFKGHEYLEIENVMNWHGKALGEKTSIVLEHLK